MNLGFSSAVITPESAEDDIKDLIKTFFFEIIIGGPDHRRDRDEEIGIGDEKNIWESADAFGENRE